MKKIFTVRLLSSIIVMLAFIASVQAEDCSSSLKEICNVFQGMSEKVKTCSSLQEFEMLDFDNVIGASSIAEIPDSCTDYELTASDKSELKKSFRTFYDSILDKLMELTYGMVSREELDAQMKPMLDQYNSVVDNSDTLGEYAVGLSAFGQ